MKNLNVFTLGLLAAFTIGCSGDDSGSDTTPPPPTRKVQVSLNGIEKLEGDLVYEGWLIVEGEAPVSTGTFDGSTDEFEFSALKTVVDAAKSFVVSIEPKNDADPAPSKTKILSGDFIVGDAAALKIDNEIGIFNDPNNLFSGTFINKTPTDDVAGGNTMNDEKGIWFMKADGTAGLMNLPVLKEGWKYEGWVIFGDTPLTTGQFIQATGADLGSPYSANDKLAPDFPGEDFLNNLPNDSNGAKIDGDTTGKKVVISIEPALDEDPNAPFFLKPISGTQGIDNNKLEVTSNINALINGTVTKL